MSNGHAFIFRKGGFAERVFTVTLLKDAFVTNGHVRHDAEAEIVEYGGVQLRFCENTGIPRVWTITSLDTGSNSIALDSSHKIIRTRELAIESSNSLHLEARSESMISSKLDRHSD